MLEERHAYQNGAMLGNEAAGSILKNDRGRSVIRHLMRRRLLEGELEINIKYVVRGILCSVKEHHNPC